MSKALGDKKRTQLITKLREIENPSSAIQFLSTAIREFPGDSDLYHKRGVKYSSIGEAGKAIADFEKALELNPSHADAMMTRATALLLQENYQEAESGFGKFITAIETDKKLHWNKIKKRIFKIAALSYRGISRTHTGDFVGAINDLDAAIALKPSQKVLQRINRAKANVLSNLGKEHLEASVENMNFLPTESEVLKCFFIKRISVFVALLCIVVSVKSCVAGSNPGTVYTQEATGETEGLSKPSQNSVSTEASPKAVNPEGSQQQSFSSALVKSNTKPDIKIGMSQSSAVSSVNQFISQHGGSYDCGSFPEDPNYQICIYLGDEALEFHVESGSVVKIF